MKEISPKYFRSLREQLEPHFGADTSYNQKEYRGGSHGHCVVVSMLMNTLFNFECVSTKLEETSHWFNRLHMPNGKTYDVDLTGDQFGHEKIRIQPAGDLYPDAKIRTFDEIDYETKVRFTRFVNRINLEKLSNQEGSL